MLLATDITVNRDDIQPVARKWQQGPLEINTEQEP